MLMEMPKVGDKVRYLSEETYDFMTTGKVYEVVPSEDDGCGYSFETTTDNEAGCGWDSSEFGVFELVVEQSEAPTPDTAALIANLALRVGELELQNAQQAHEINELYRADAERGVLR